MNDEVERLRAQLSQTVSLLQLRNKQIERLTAAQGKLQEELDTKTVELRHKTVSKTKRRAPRREKQQARIDELTREVRCAFVYREPAVHWFGHLPSTEPGGGGAVVVALSTVRQGGRGGVGATAARVAAAVPYPRTFVCAHV